VYFQKVFKNSQDQFYFQLLFNVENEYNKLDLLAILFYLYSISLGTYEPLRSCRYYMRGELEMVGASEETL